MKIYYEDSMPYAAEFFTELGDCQVFSHKTVTPEQIADADVLLVRSTTKVNAQLLAANAQIKYVGTATAGTNHVDKAYLAERGIRFTSAAGCNAVAVAEYVLSSLFVMSAKLNWTLANLTVGIVGAGHVGTALAQKLAALGIACKLCDPPLQDAGDPRALVSRDEIMQCDVISLHVPLVKSGPYPTEHLFDSARLQQLSDKQLLINACRGEVLDNQAALSLFEQGKIMHLVLDVWENEPNISLPLVNYVALGTAHIAGHTIEGKSRGTAMLYHDLCEFFGLNGTKQLSDYLPQVDEVLTVNTQADEWQALQELVLAVYDIAEDDRHFKATVAEPDQFGYIRKHYPIRREFSAIKVNTGNFAQSKAIYALGFSKA